MLFQGQTGTLSNFGTLIAIASSIVTIVVVSGERLYKWYSQPTLQVVGIYALNSYIPEGPTWEN